MKAVLILSGGMDSTTLAYYLKDQKIDFDCMSFDYGQRHKKELESAKITCRKLGVTHKIFNADILNKVAPSSLTRKETKVPEGHYEDESMKQTVVPNRNMIMLALAAAYAMGIKANKIYYGVHTGDHAIYPDCRPEFVQKMKAILQIADWTPIDLEAPFLHLTKGEICRVGIKLKVPYEDTWTCYKGLKKACGKCGACTERLEAFKYAGSPDPIPYQ